MENQANPLDDSFILSPSSETIFVPATAWQRFANMIIDTVAFYFLVFIIFILLGFLFQILSGGTSGLTEGLSYLIIFGIYFFYYVFFENQFGKTIGKMVTKTRVVNLEGVKPSRSTILLRTVCRFIPFEAFTFLGSGHGMHDRLSKTMVVKM